MIKYLRIALISILAFSGSLYGQDCTISITRPSADTTICLGDSVYLKSEGSCDVFLNNSFEGGIGVGWSSTAANPTFPEMGCDDEYGGAGPGPRKQYLWVGTNAAAERSIITEPFDITIGYCSVKFWMRYGRADNAGTCEDPNSPGEGVHLQYSIDDGANWTDFPGTDMYPKGDNLLNPPFDTPTPGTGGYWTPTGYCDIINHCDTRYDTSRTFWWHEYACPVPATGETTATKFRFIQFDNQQNYDSWGLDEVKIFCSNNQNVVWSHGPTVFNPVDPVSPLDTTIYWVMVYDTLGNSASDTVTINVALRPDTDLGNDTTICWDGTNTAYFDAGAGFDSYLWNTGETTQFITPDVSGTYIVEVWNATCYDTDTVNLLVIPATVANAGSDESVCQGDAWDFSRSGTVPDTLSADSLFWFGGIGTFNDPTVIYPIYTTDITELGAVSIGLIAYGSGPCGNDTNYMTLTVDTVPIVDYTTTPIDTSCVNADILFQGTANCDITNWRWDFGDASFGNGQNVTHAYSATGTYNIKLHVENAYGCVDSITYTRVITDPNIGFTDLPGPSCENDTVFFDGQGDMVTYADWIWDFGDGSPVDTGRNVNHVYPAAGVYTVTLNVCNKDSIRDHTVFGTCDVDAGSDEIICEHYAHEFVNSAVQPSAANYDSLRWSGGAGTFDDPRTLLPIYTPGTGELGDITLTLVAYGLVPCGNDTATMVLSVLDGPEADFTYLPNDSLCVSELIDFMGSSTTNIISWDWDFGDGIGTASGQNVSYAYTADGFYDVQLIVENDTACVDTVIYTLEIHILPDADFSITPGDSVCLNTPMTFDGNSSTNILSWDWDFGDGNNGNGQSVNHTYAAPGDYAVQLFVYNENSCTDTVLYPVTIFDLPTSDFTMSPNDTNCVNEEVFFAGTGSPDVVDWLWNFDDGNSDNGQNVSHTYAAAGTYDVMLIVTNGNGCLDTTIHTREVIFVDVDFTVTPTPSCLGDSVYFDGIGNVTFTDWLWDFGDGDTAIGQNVAHLYTTYDTFDIMLVVCSDTTYAQHIVQQPTSANAGSNETICEHYPFDFATSAIPPTANAYDSLRWFGGAGTFNDNTLLLPTYTPAVGEIGPVQLSLISLARIPCANDTSEMTLTIFDGPEADFTITPPDSICVDEWVSLDATSTTTITSWDWDFGDGNTGTGQNTGHAWAAAGLHDIRLVVTNSDMCYDTVIYTIEVFELPVADFNILPNDSICRLEELTFDASSSTNVLTWNWDYGDGFTDAGQTVNHTYAAMGTYNVYLYVYNENSCVDTVMKQVTIFELPTSDFTMSPNDTNCVNEEVFFAGTGSPDVVDWNWDFDDGNFANGQNVSHTYAAAGTYDVMLIVTNDNGCYDTTIHQREVIFVDVDLSVTPSPSCFGDSVYFDGIGNVTFTDWFWDFGDGDTAIGQNVAHLYTTYDTFDIMLVVCSDTTYGQHIVTQPAQADAGSDEGICEGYSFNFASSTIIPSAVSYDSLRWSGGIGTFNDIHSLIPIYTPAVGELGLVPLTLVAYGRETCVNDTSTMILDITDSPEATITTTPPDSLCVDEWITFDGSATTAINTWTWDLDDGTTGTGASFGHSFSAAGFYNVELIALNVGSCADTTYLNIQIHELPVADFTIAPGNAICTNEELMFNGSSSTNVLDWNWDFGDGNTANGQNVTHAYNAFGSYTVSLFVYNENSCRDTMTRVVNIFELPACDFTISPNDSSCVNELITFNGSGTADIIAWDWDFGDGVGVANGQVVNYTYTAAGTYDVRLIVTNNNGCLDTMYHQRVVVQPTIDFNMSLSPSCEGYVVDFTAIGNYDFTDYVWDFGDGFNDIGRNVNHIFATPNTYTITLTFCTSQIQHDILVNPLPTAFAGQDTTSCEDVPFDLSTLPLPPNATNYSSILWFGGIGSFDNPTLMAPVYTPAPGELGFVTLNMVAYGIAPCYNDTSSMTIEVIEGAYAFAGSDEHSCQGDPFNFATSAQSPAAYNELNRMWTGGAGFFVDPTAEVPIYVPDPNELGPILLTFVASNVLNCDSLDEMILTIHPVYEETQNFSICFGDSLLLPGGSWQYTSGIYTDTLQSVWGCDSVVITDLFVYPKIDADFNISPNDSACVDDDFFFTQTGSANLIAWNWDFGDGNFSTDANPSHAYSIPGIYTVRFSYTDDIGCQDVTTHDVFVYFPPQIDFNTSLSSACLNSGISFFGISPDNILSWDWDFGDGGTGAGQNVTHTYTTFGAMQVTLYVMATNGCMTSITKPIFVAEPPNADFTFNILSCDTIQFTDLSTCPQGYFIVKWDWDFGDGDSSNLQNPAHAFSAGGVYDVMLIITSDSSGLLCTDSLSRPVLVPDRPTVYFSWTPEPTCLGDVTTFFGTSGNPITEWYWDFDDGNFATSQNPEHTFTAPGVYNVMLFATDQNGCWDTISHQVTVSDIPDVSFTVDPNPGCAGEQMSFSGNSAAMIDTWLWDFGDGGSSVNQNPVHVYSVAGTYLVTLWVGDTNNCFNMASQWVVVNPMPLADFTASQGTCSGDTVFFYNQSVSPNGSIDSWTWDFGDGNSVTVNAPNDPDVIHIYASGGTYNVTLTVVDEDSCSNFIIKPVTVADGPTADFNYEDNCNGQPVVFTDISTPNGGSPIVSWYWEFDDPPSGGANTSTQQNPTHLFTTPGTYDVLLMVTNVEGCSNTIVSAVEVSAAPMVSFTTDGDSACVMNEISFFGNASTSVTWSWDFGDGGVSVLQDPVHVYADPGTYNVIVTVEAANGCTNSFTSQVYINPLPIADFTFSSLPCSGSPVEFFDISSPMNTYMLSWHWYFGDGTDTVIFAPSSGNVAHTYANPGPYTVSLAIENANTCEDSIAYQVVVIQGPEAAFDYSGDVCQGGSVAFTDMSQGFGSVVQGWLWNFGDPGSGSNNTSTLQNPTHVFSTAGSFAVTLSVTANTGCQHTVIDTVEIAPPPPVDWYMSPDTACLGDITYFFTDTDSTDVPRVTAFFWEFGDPASGANNTSDLQDPVHIYNAAGTYVVSLTITDVDGCENSSVHSIEINPPPIADYSYEQACLGDSTLFFDESVSQTAVINSWQWNFGDPASGVYNTSDLQNTGHVFTDLGTYNVQLITTDYFGCSDTIVKTLVVDYAPTSFYTYNQPCEPAGLIFFSDSSYSQVGASPITQWLWELEPGQFSSEINPIYTFQQLDTTYVVYLTVTDANGCENTFMDSVRVDEPLTLDFMATRVCHGDSSYFKGYYGPSYDQITSWTWDFGDGNTIVTIEDSVFYQYAQPGTYLVMLTIENAERCEKSLSKQVIVDALPVVDFAFSAALCDEPTQFTDMTNPGAGAIVQSWQWNFGDAASGDENISAAQNPMHTYPAIDSTYFVSLVVTNNHACVDSLELPVAKGLCMQATFEPSGDDQCNNTQVCFVDSSYIVGDNYAIQTWRWAFGDGLWEEYNSYQDSVCHEYAQSGMYSVSLTVSTEIDGIVYSDVTNRQIMVSAVPSAAMTLQAPCAEGQTRFFDISDTHGVEIVGWQWDFGVPQIDTDTSSLENPVYSYSEAGTYTVQLIVENQNGCMDTTLMDINVFNAPEADFTSSIACAGGTTEFTDQSIPAEGELSQWLWNFGNGETSGEQDPWHVYTDTGDFLVQMVITDDNLCTDTAVNMLSVFPVPLSLFDITDRYENIQGQILLDNLSENAVRYEWDLGDGTTSELFAPVVRYEDDGTYLIELIAWNDNNCPDTAYMEYTIVFQGLYVPTGFTPESDNIALREFKPAGINLQSYRVTVINQWGNIIWQSNKLDANGSPMEGWDGTVNGEPQPSGTYMWTISAKFQDGTIWNGTDAGDGNTKTYGTVLLIR